MKISLEKSQIRGNISAPASKSDTIRGLMCAALATGESHLLNPLLADDTQAAAEVLGKIGVRINREGNIWRVNGGNFHAPETELFCRDSAATIRFMTALCALVPGRCQLTAGPSLAGRPVQPLAAALQKLGVSCSSNGDYPPVTVAGGRLKGGQTEIAGDISSQFISALLFIAPLAEKGISIRLTTPLASKPYVRMTIDCQNKFGVKIRETGESFAVSRQTYQPARFTVEEDWSSASYFLALGATAGEITITNLNPASRQGDRIMLDFLKEMGAGIKIGSDSVTVSQAPLHPLHANLTDCIDLLPTLAILAAAADGASELTGIRRARLKESNRVAAVKEGLQRLGIKVIEKEDRLVIYGGKIHPAQIDAWGDHRIAMAFAIPGIINGGVTITGAESVGKTFPQFWAILEGTGGKLTRHEQ
ncbi:3-phosphoshikimate 1-carboxyvinyltransferase [Chloroflexota bacterium]